MKRIVSAIVCLLGLYFVSGSISAQPKDAKAKDALPSQVTGLGETLEKAKANALHEAVKTVDAHMKRHDPPLRAFAVDEDYVRKHLLVDEGQPGEDLRIENIDGAFKSWVVTFRYNWSNDVLREDRSASRQRIASIAIFGLSILLLIGVGYVRLDNYTNHRRTAWLRAAGSVLLAIILAASYLYFLGW